MAESSSALTSWLDRLRPLLAKEAQPVYIVGGTVRDAVMGRAIHDLDLAVAAGAIPLTFRLADRLGLPAYVLDAERDVGRIIAPDEAITLGEATTLDIARFRGPTLADDLYGRDFTLNALALPVAGQMPGDVIDLHHGLDDIAARRVRIVHAHSINDDPLRALRAARFAAQLEFELTDETAAAARTAGREITERVSPERVRDELSRLLTSGAPNRGLALLGELELLSFVLPDVAALDGVAQSPPHREDVLAHTLSVLRYLAQIERVVDGFPPHDEWGAAVDALIAAYRPELRAHLERTEDGSFKGRLLLMWGGLFHDVGKRATQTIDAGGHIRFLGHDDVGADITGRSLSRFSFSNDAVRHGRAIVAGHMRPLLLAKENRPPSRRSTYRYFRALHGAGLDVGLLALADHLATYDGIGDNRSWQALLVVVGALFEAYFQRHEQAVAPPRLLDGRAIMEMLDAPPGREIGRLLQLLEEAQAVGEVTSRDEAEVFVRRHAQT